MTDGATIVKFPASMLVGVNLVKYFLPISVPLYSSVFVSTVDIVVLFPFESVEVVYLLI